VQKHNNNIDIFEGLQYGFLMLADECLRKRTIPRGISTGTHQCEAAVQLISVLTS
jgi:hypothetical protein